MTLYCMTDERMGYMPASEWWEKQHRARLCAECGLLTRGGGLIPVELRDRIPPRTVHFFQSKVGVGFIHDKLVRVLGEAAVHEALLLADAYGPLEGPTKGWHVFWGREPLVQRGDDQVSTRNCGVCQRVFYSAGGTLHVTPKAPVGEIYERFPGSLLVSERLVEKIKAELPSARLRATKVEVLAEPLDGLGPFPTCYVMGVPPR